ncbi:MAG: hypothetical protein M1831_004329 [Alyxoria varia]|nr:MAG: hypothetical protein M1831_004329 [Alyxoria varia]
MAVTRRWRPLIAIIGATGTGKSNLAVDLALRFNGEIINGDAMQLYDGLPIITNKIPAHERRGVPHHLLGCIGLHETTWTVGNFVRQATAVIDEMHAKGKLPILVGGTHYYTQSLLFKETLSSAETAESKIQSQDGQNTPINAANGGASHAILDASSEEMHEKLREVDPVMASRWHPRDRRKNRRSLEIWLQTGRKASEVYSEQRRRKQARHEALQQEHKHEQDRPAGPVDQGNDNDTEGQSSDDGMEPSGSTVTNSSSISSPLRYPTLLLWTHMPFSTLLPRLNDRISTMMANGLLSEVSRLDAVREDQIAQGRPPDMTRGIWVSIGYKEFEQYVSALNRGKQSMDAKEEDSLKAHEPRDSRKEQKDAVKQEKYLENLKNDAVERTQIATRRYAKSQVRWIRNKLVSALNAAVASKSLYLLDIPDYDEFKANSIPANEIEQVNNSNPADNKGLLAVEVNAQQSSPYDHHILQPAIQYTQEYLTHRGTSSLPDPASTSSLAAELLSPASSEPNQNEEALALNDSANAHLADQVMAGETGALAYDPNLKTRACPVCSVTTTNDKSWIAHLKGRRHKLNVKGALKRGEAVPEGSNI